MPRKKQKCRRRHAATAFITPPPAVICCFDIAGAVFFLYIYIYNYIFFLLMSQWDERGASKAASRSAIAPSGSCTNMQLALLQQRFSQIFGLKDPFSLSLSTRRFILKSVPTCKIQYSDLASDAWPRLTFTLRVVHSGFKTEVACSRFRRRAPPRKNSTGDSEHQRKIPVCH